MDDLLPGDAATLSVRAFADPYICDRVRDAMDAGCKAFAYIPNFWETYDPRNLAVLSAAADIADGIYINNIGQLRLAKDTGLPVYGDSGLNVFNAETALFFMEQGLEGVTLSYELGEETAALVKQINQRVSEAMPGSSKGSRFKTETLVRGRVPAMFSRYCPVAGALGIKKDKCGACSKTGKVFLEDGRGEAYPVITDRENCTSLILSKNILKNRPCGDICRITV